MDSGLRDYGILVCIEGSSSGGVLISRKLSKNSLMSSVDAFVSSNEVQSIFRNTSETSGIVDCVAEISLLVVKTSSVPVEETGYVESIQMTA
jgi:hypothetical protein